jgi:nitrite reductase/ring-hydroxylating ferredoxin subunit
MGRGLPAPPGRVVNAASYDVFVPGNKISTSEIERRHFLQGALAATGLPPLCCTSQALPASSIAFEPGKITVELARAPELRRAGSAFNVVDEGRKINFLLLHAERGHFVALDRACTHGGAQCTYNPKRHTLQCTSLNHAEYDLRGTLLHGRTHGNLRTYPTKFSGSIVEIMLEATA